MQTAPERRRGTYPIALQETTPEEVRFGRPGMITGCASARLRPRKAPLADLPLAARSPNCKGDRSICQVPDGQG